MNARGWSLLCLAAVSAALSGCLLVQPLDDAKSDSTGSGGTTNAGGKTSAAGQSNGVSGADDGGGDAGEGATPAGGSGSTPEGGSTATGGSGNSSGGGPTSGVDFSLFLGKWYPTGGTISTLCSDSGSTTPTVEDVTLDYYDQFDLGTTSDLIWDKPGSCPLYIVVDDRTASNDPNAGTQTCMIKAETTNYPIKITYSSFEFDVDAGDQTASSSSLVTDYVTDTNGNFVRTCTQDIEVTHSRSAPSGT